MSKIVVCYKWVVDETDIKLNSNNTVNIGPESKISDYDLNAIEFGVKLSKSMGATPIGLCFSGPNGLAGTKYALSRGLEEAYLISSANYAFADGRSTAKALAAQITKFDNTTLIICSDSAVDSLSRQTAPRIAAILNLPVVTGVVAAKLCGSKLNVYRKAEACIENIEVELPAVISVLPEICAAPVPGLAAVMKAKKKKVEEISFASLSIDVEPKNIITETRGESMNRKNVIFKDGTVSELAKVFAEALKQEGVI